MPGASRNLRGSSYNRRARRAWLIAQFGVARAHPRKGHKPGEKVWICCFHCGRRMRVTSRWEVDRYPLCGHDGGRYVRGNIVPSCAPCNNKRCTVARRCREWSYTTV